MNRGIEITITKGEIVALMAAEAKRLGVPGGLIVKRRDGVDLLVAGRLHRLAVPPGPLGLARDEALKALRALITGEAA